MTVLELCSHLRNPKYQEVILYSVDNEVVFMGSADCAMVSDFVKCEVADFRPMNYTIIVHLST